MIYITKCSVSFSFISRYSQLLGNVVSSCHATNVPPASHIVPNPESYPKLRSQPLLLPVRVILADLQKEVEQKRHL
jgi:hypothetical protein